MTNADFLPADGKPAGIVLVTGGAGFIGRVVVDALGSAGFSLRAGVRHVTSVPSPFPCDLDRPEQVRAAVKGVRLVVHTAYGDSAAMARQCQTLLDAMAAEGVGALITLSSIAVYGERTGEIREADSPQGQLDTYAMAKRDCEARIQDWAAAGGRRALILRPGIVYGRGSPFWIDKLVLRIKRGVWGTFGPSGEGTAALVHVDDLAALITTAAGRLLSAEDTPLPDVAVLNVVGPETPSWNAYFEALARALGAPPLARLGQASVVRRQAIALAAKIWRRLGLPGGAGAALAPMPGELALFARKASYRTEAVRDLIGFAPQIGLAEGLRRSLQTSR